MLGGGVEEAELSLFGREILPDSLLEFQRNQEPRKEENFLLEEVRGWRSGGAQAELRERDGSRFSSRRHHIVSLSEDRHRTQNWTCCEQTQGEFSRIYELAAKIWLR